MEDKSTPTMEKTQPNLCIPPHILDELFRLITGEWQPSPAKQQQVIAHLATCSHCRTALIVLLSAVEKQEQLDTPGKTSAHDILTSFVAIHHELAALDHEQMGTYAEMLVSSGQKEADKHFPILALHISKCPGCQSQLKGILTFLKGGDTTS